MVRRLAVMLLPIAVALAMLAGVPGARAATATSVTLQWTAPGDDSLTGTATTYDVRFSTATITAANFPSATQATGAPSPLPAGTQQSMNVTGLSPATTYWFAIKTADERGNWSGISNVVQFTTPASNDSIRPAPLAIGITTTTATSVTLAWNAVGDDSLTGTASQYDVRWSATPITSANFGAASRVLLGVPTPLAPGTPQSVTVGNLDRTVDLYFAVKTADEVNNWSAISNVVTAPHLVDAAPPATPTGLAASVDAGGVHLHWNPNSEPDLAGYHVYRALSAGGAWARLDGTTLVASSYVDAAPPDSASLWYQVTAVDQTGNESGATAALHVWLNASGIDALRLQPVYPNPSSLTEPVAIPVAVPPSGPFDGRLDILDAAGERVRSLPLHGLTPGTTTLTWDGRNDAGRVTAPGVYRALLHAGSSVQAVKLVRRP